MDEGLLARTRALADEVLFPRALETDAADLVPLDLLDRLATEGFYGMAAPVGAGGWDLSRADVATVVETLVGGCLSTAFVWIQHHNVVRAIAATGNTDLREVWLGRLARGERRAGIALAGERPGPPLLTATTTGDGLVLEGAAPWVTGWGRIDAVLVAAREGEVVHRVLVDAVAAPGLTVAPLRLVAANASGTVTATFRDHLVPTTRSVATEAHADALTRDAGSLRGNGAFALGVASRCLRLLGPSDLDAGLERVRAELDTADPETMPGARAKAAAFAWRAAGALVASAGARSIVTDAHAQRLAREAMFCLVFGSRPTIKERLLPLLTV